MKTIYNLIFTSFFLILLISCGVGNNGKIVLNTEKGLDKVKKLLKNEFGENKEITSLSFSNKNADSNELDQITISFTENSNDAIWFYSFTMNKLFKPEQTTKSKSGKKMRALKEFKTDEILTHFNNAVAIVTKETNEFKNFQLGRYSMDVNQNSSKIEHRFQLQADKKDDKTSFYGTRLDINKNRFNFSFRTNEKGELICTEGIPKF